MALSLIDKQDNFEIIRGQIASILKLEIVNQIALATAAGKPDPLEWNVRIFEERSNPWETYLDPDVSVDKSPIANVWWDSANYDKASSDRTERQKSISIYNIDIFGYGVSEDDGATGHTPGDLTAALESQRAIRLIRNILMAAENRYLLLRGMVWDRFILNITPFQPANLNDNAIKILGSRIKFEVEHNEFSPQVELEDLEVINSTITNSEGEVIIDNTIDYT